MAYVIVGVICLIGGAALGFYFTSKTDDECKNCRRSYDEQYDELRGQIHGLKSSKGKLGKDLNAMTFRNAGFKAR